MAVYKDPRSPYYQIELWIAGNRVKRSSKTTDKKVAQQQERELKDQLRKDYEQAQRTGVGPLTFDQAAAKYMIEKGQKHVRASDTYTHLERLSEHLGSIRLDQITDSHVFELVAKFRDKPRWGRKTRKDGSPMEPVSAATINRTVILPLKAVFTWAKKMWKLSLPLEPAWSEHWEKGPKRLSREVTINEIETLADALRDDFAPWLKFARISGWRRNETLIRWHNVHWEAGFIENIGKRGKVRQLPIIPAIKAILDECRGHHPVWVFTYICQRSGENPKTHETKFRGERYPITPEVAKTQWRRTRKKAGIEDARFHLVRHTFGSSLLRRSQDLKLTQEALGHTSIKTTETYLHTIPGSLAAALQVNAEAMGLGGNPSKAPPTGSQEAA